jgi:hypothetical protein
MEKQHQFFIGITDSPLGTLWRDRVHRSDSSNDVVWLRTEPHHFKDHVDVEILATSIVCVRLGLIAPKNGAASYSLGREEGYAPITIIPPALGIENSPPNFKGSILDKEYGNDDLPKYIWGTIFQELARVITKSTAKDIKVGFHIALIGYWGKKKEDNIDAFINEYAHFMKHP